MQVKKGENRLALIIGGLTIKFPIIHLIISWRIFWDELKHGYFHLLRKECFEYTIEHRGIKRFLFKGIVDNWREFCFYRRFKLCFTQPTYFSLFGLINLQQTGPRCQIKEDDLWVQLTELTENKVFKDSHTFANPVNFCVCNGQLRILDYASSHVQKVIVEYGDRIVKEFDTNYSREKRIKRTKKKNI